MFNYSTAIKLYFGYFAQSYFLTFIILHVSFPLRFIWLLAQTFGNYSDIKLMTHLIWSKASQQRVQAWVQVTLIVGILSKNMDSASLMSIYYMCLHYHHPP